MSVNGVCFRCHRGLKYKSDGFAFWYVVIGGDDDCFVFVFACFYE